MSGAICRRPNPEGDKSIGPYVDQQNSNEHLTTHSGQKRHRKWMRGRDERRKCPEGSSTERLLFLSPAERSLVTTLAFIRQTAPQNHFRWVIELLNCKNRRKALCWGQQRAEGTIPLLKASQRWRNVPDLSRCLHFPFCCWGGSVTGHMCNLTRLFPLNYVLSN